MSVADTIRAKLTKGLAPLHLDVLNESHKHNVPPGSESHFKLIVASAAFTDMKPLQRHRKVYELLKEETDHRRVHALELVLFTPTEWEKSPLAPASPPCLGGSKPSV